MELKNSKNQQTEVPLAYYLERYRAIDPEARARELGIAYEGGRFRLTMLGSAYAIAWPGGEFSSDDDTALAVRDVYGQILLLRWLIDGKDLPAPESWLTFREMPWGEVYIKTYNGRCIGRLARKFGRDEAALESFRRGAAAIGGRPLTHGDAGFEFDFLGEYRLRAFLWLGDEEYPPNAQILYSGNFAAGFSAEDNVAVAELLIGAIAGKC